MRTGIAIFFELSMIKTTNINRIRKLGGKVIYYLSYNDALVDVQSFVKLKSYHRKKEMQF